MSDYANLRTLPAGMAAIFFVLSLFQFGAIAPVEVLWYEYTLTTEHAMIGSLVIYAAAFMSSETRSFDHYTQGEKILIGASPVLIVGNEYVGFINDAVMASEPWGQVVAFLIAMAGIAVATQ